MPNDQAHDPRVASAIDRNAQAVSLTVPAVEASPLAISTSALDSTTVEISLDTPHQSAVNYDIQRGLDGVNFSGVFFDVLPGDFPYTDLDQTPEETYYYRLAAYDGGGALLGYSNVSSVTLPAADSGSQAAPGWRGNEPTGYTAHPELTFENNQIQTGWLDYDTANLSYITDATNPAPGDKVGRALYPEGDAGGDSTINIGSVDTGKVIKEVYFCVAFRMDPDFQYHTTGSNKFIFVNVAGWGGSGDPYIFILNSDTDPAQARGELQGTPNGVVQWPPNAGAEILKGEWYIAEARLVMNSPGTADGIYEQWVHRVSTGEVFKTHNETAVEYVGDVYDFRLPKIQNTWGGIGDTVTVPGGFYLDIGGLYTSYKEAA